MDIFLLGAGRPACGEKPSALKHITLNTKTMDWQIHSFEAVAVFEDIHYLGGYHVEDVIKDYPGLKFTVIPDWQNKGILHTLLSAPFSEQPAIVSYSDTIFRKAVLEGINLVEADVVFGVDTQWEARFEKRPVDDISIAETLEMEDATGAVQLAEFTGLIRFSSKAIQVLKDLEEPEIGTNLLHLLAYLKDKGLAVETFDVDGNWAELNVPEDIAHFILGTKAETLSRIAPRVKKSHIGKQVSFTVAQWGAEPDSVLNQIDSVFHNTKLIVRSSSKGEDNWLSSHAGGFESLLDIDSEDKNQLAMAIKKVINSYGNSVQKDDQVLVQACLENVRLAGVVFTCGLETGAPYYRFNFDDQSHSTESVTAGIGVDLRTIIVSRFDVDALKNVAAELVPVLDAVIELEQLLGFDKLDIEFAIDEKGVVHIFQVRPITIDHSEYEVADNIIEMSLSKSIEHFISAQAPPPFSYSTKTLFANMPDWNPAEIIGTHPKPLAFSLYRYLITNEVWAQQRQEYGYRDVRPYPLIVSFSGQPFVDVRASLNSFIPDGLSEETTERIANAYVNLLADNPHHHDKIEFEVAFTIWTPEISSTAKARLKPYGVTESDISALEYALKRITQQALTRLPRDIESVGKLALRREEVLNTISSPIDKVISLLDDCKRFGTLAFAHAARAGFVAMALLKSFVATGSITDKRRLAFLKSFCTVTGELEKDKRAYKAGSLTEDTLLAKYGHLRPGTYDVTAQAYWEDPPRYLTSDNSKALEAKTVFEFTAKELSNFQAVLDELGSSLTPDEMIEYLVSAICSRESVKFEFTKNLSCSLDLCVELGSGLGLSREKMAFLEYSDLEQLKLNTVSTEELISRIDARKQQYAVTRLIALPPLIQKESDFYCFERLSSQPNFVTINKVNAPVQLISADSSGALTGKIILTPQADPGYDWLFGQGIVGLITKYGGANSHMAIRAAEMGLPAVIGVGDKLYEKISAMKHVELDCMNQTIREIV